MEVHQAVGQILVILGKPVEIHQSVVAASAYLHMGAVEVAVGLIPAQQVHLDMAAVAAAQAIQVRRGVYRLAAAGAI
jgi:hypothetical protein